MRRSWILTPVVLVVFLGVLVGFLRVPAALGQDATPGAGAGTPEAITIQEEAFAPVTAFPQPGVLGITRATFAPGAVLPLGPSDPSLGFFLVESGTITVRQDVPIGVIRAGTVFVPGTPIAQEMVGADTEVTLTAGDAFISPPNGTG